MFWAVNDSLVGLRAARDIVVPGENFTVQSGKKITRNAVEALKRAKVASVDVAESELEGAFAAADVVDPSTGEVILEANEPLEPRVISMAQEMKVERIDIPSREDAANDPLPAAIEDLQSPPVLTVVSALTPEEVQEAGFVPETSVSMEPLDIDLDEPAGEVDPSLMEVDINLDAPPPPKTMAADADAGFEVATIKPSNPDNPAQFLTIGRAGGKQDRAVLVRFDKGRPVGGVLEVRANVNFHPSLVSAIQIDFREGILRSN